MTSAEAAARHWDAVPEGLIAARENEVWRLRLPGGAPAALRLHRAGYQTAGAIRSELWWCGQLAAAGVPVPAPVPGVDGTALLALPDGRLASVVTWAEGEPIGAAGVLLAGDARSQSALHRDLGRLIARVHAATAALALPDWFTRPSWDLPGLVGEAPFWGRFWEHPAATPDQRRSLLRARGWLAERLADHARDARLLPIHADVLRENVLAGPDGLSLIDFDDAGFGLPLYDLGTVLSQCLSEPAFPAIRGALIEGYGTGDGATVDAMTLMRCCASVGWTMPRLPPDHPVHRSHLARACALADRLVR